MQKAQIEKWVLAAVLFGVVLYSYWAFLLEPLWGRERQVSAAAGDLDRKLRETRELVARGDRARLEGPSVRKVLGQVGAMIPEGAPVAWFPSQVSGVFREHGIGKSGVRLISESPEKGFEGFGRTVWTVEVPRAEFVPLVRSIADLENGQPLVEIISMGIEGHREDPEQLRAVLGLKRLVKK